MNNILTIKIQTHVNNNKYRERYLQYLMHTHTLYEVGISGTVLMRVYSGTIMPIFIEIGLPVFERHGAIEKLAQFFSETQCIILNMVSQSFTKMCRPT